MYKVKRFSQEGDRMKFYHATANKNVKSILRNGLLGSESHRKDAITNMSRNMTGSSKDLIYLSNDGESAKYIKQVIDDHLGGGTILHINMPLKEYKKLKIVDNPEFLGAKSYEDFIKRYKEKYKDALNQSSIPNRHYYDIMNNRTTVIEGDIPPEFIEESPKYRG